MLVLGLGVLAGLLTTVAGMGGGLLLLLALSLRWGPERALAVTALALLAGNLHRAYTHRDQVHSRIAGAFSLGAVPGALIGGLVAAALPAVLVEASMLAITALAIARAAGAFAWRASPTALVPAGVGIGAISATSGGAAVLTGPLFLAAGLTGRAYVGTVAVAAVALHAARIVAYGAGGWIDHQTVLRAAALAAAIMAGNLLGMRLRDRIPERAGRGIEIGTLLIAVGLAIAGVG